MSEVFCCDDKETFVAYLYGEVEADVRREVERHLRTCAACTREAEGLQAVRQDLQVWVAPEPALGWTMVPPVSAQSAPAPVLTSPRWAAAAGMPAWARVAAAVLLIGAGVGLANIQVRSSSDGFVVTTGWMQSPAVPVSAAPAPAQPVRASTAAASQPADEAWRVELARIERSLRDEFAAERASTRRVATGGTVDGADLLRRVQAMINQSEERQRQEVASKLIQADRMWNVRRQNDLVNVQRTLGSLQNRNIAVQATQQEAINQLRRVSFVPPPNQ